MKTLNTSWLWKAPISTFLWFGIASNCSLRVVFQKGVHWFCSSLLCNVPCLATCVLLQESNIKKIQDSLLYSVFFENFLCRKFTAKGNTNTKSRYIPVVWNKWDYFPLTSVLVCWFFFQNFCFSLTSCACLLSLTVCPIANMYFLLVDGYNQCCVSSSRGLHRDSYIFEALTVH